MPDNGSPIKDLGDLNRLQGADAVTAALANSVPVPDPDAPDPAVLLIAPFEDCDDMVLSLLPKGGGIKIKVPGLEDLVDALQDELILVGGFRSAGKSTLMMQGADALLEDGHAVLIVAQEQPWQKLEAISLSRRAKMNSRRLMGKMELRPDDITLANAQQADPERNARLRTLRRYSSSQTAARGAIRSA